jgi:hypothetical protein
MSPPIARKTGYITVAATTIIFNTARLSILSLLNKLTVGLLVHLSLSQLRISYFTPLNPRSSLSTRWRVCISANTTVHQHQGYRHIIYIISVII